MGAKKWLGGPWEVDPTAINISVRRVGPLEHGARYRVATVGSPGRSGDDTDLATANLIAAAPEMYEALLKCVAADPTIVTNRPGWMDYVASIEGARAALKKARGES